MRKVTRETITLTSRYFDDEITFRAVRLGCCFLISKRQARRIPKDRGIAMQAMDHKITGEYMPVIVDN